MTLLDKDKVMQPTNIKVCSHCHEQFNMNLDGEKTRVEVHLLRHELQLLNDLVNNK